MDICEILKNINKVRELLNDLEARINKDMEAEYHQWKSDFFGYVLGLKSSNADIERSCLMARKYLKECYGDNNSNYYSEIVDIAKSKNTKNSL